MLDLLNKFNFIQLSIQKTDRKIWKFTGNREIIDSCLAGHMMKKSSEAKYRKIKNLSTASKKQIFLQTNCEELSISHFILPLNTSRIISVFFTLTHSIYIELFNHMGQKINSTLVAENTFFPLLSNTSDKFVICFSEKINGEYFPVKHIMRLCDSELNVLKEINVPHNVESVFMNDESILVSFNFYEKSVEDRFHLYDLDLVKKESFGQQTDKNKPFYFKKLVLDRKRDLKTTANSYLFGLSSTKIYLHDKNNLLIICRKNGNIINTLKKKSEFKYFLDELENIIEINIEYKEVCMQNFDVGSKGKYDIEADDVFLFENYFFAFVNTKEFSIIII